MRARGFTLIEMMITVALLGLLALGAMPLAKLGAQRLREQELRAALRDIRTAIDAYKAAADSGRIQLNVDESGFPPRLELLAEGVADAHDPARQHTLYFLRRIPRDPFATDAALSAADSWGLRSYASPPEAPEAGNDVYDVYTRAAGTALDGSRYRDW